MSTILVQTVDSAFYVSPIYKLMYTQTNVLNDNLFIFYLVFFSLLHYYYCSL